MKGNGVVIEVDATPVVGRPEVEGQEYIESGDGTIVAIVRKVK